MNVSKKEKVKAFVKRHEGPLAVMVGMTVAFTAGWRLSDTNTTMRLNRGLDLMSKANPDFENVWDATLEMCKNK